MNKQFGLSYTLIALAGSVSVAIFFAFMYKIPETKVLPAMNDEETSSDLWCGVDTYGGKSYCRLSTARILKKKSDNSYQHSAQESTNFADCNIRQKGLIRLLVVSLNNHSKTPNL